MGAIVPRPDLVPDLSKSGDRFLAQCFERISKRAHEIVEDVLGEASDEGSLPVSAMSVRTKIASQLVLAERAAERNRQTTNNFFGIMVMPARESEAEWEARAQRVEEQQRERALIDAQEERDAGPVAADPPPSGAVPGDGVEASSDGGHQEHGTALGGTGGV